MTDYRPRLFASDADVAHIGEGMLAEARARLAVDAAAGIGAERLDPPHRRVQPLARRRLDRLAAPAGELTSERAGHRAEIGHRRADLEQLHRAQGGAAALETSVVEDTETDSFAGEIDMALQRFRASRIGASRLLRTRSRLRTRRRSPLVAPRDTGRQQEQGPQGYPPPHRRILRRRQGRGQAARVEKRHRHGRTHFCG